MNRCGKRRNGSGSLSESHFAVHNGSCRIIENARSHTLLITGLLVRFQHGAVRSKNDLRICLRELLISKRFDRRATEAGWFSFAPNEAMVAHHEGPEGVSYSASEPQAEKKKRQPV